MCIQCSVCILILLIHNRFQPCEENYMASYNGYCRILFSFPGTEVQIVPNHSKSSVREISPDSFANFLSYNWEWSSHPQSLHVVYVISPCAHPKILISFLVLSLVQRGVTGKQKLYVEVDEQLQELLVFPPGNPQRKWKILFPCWNFLSSSDQGLCVSWSIP